jgi:alkylation response protein AidB-like acyl-CoA dehydrogenase
LESNQQWIDKARALTPLLAAAAPRIEEGKALPPDVLDALHGAKLFRMLLPKSLDGAELDLGSFFQAILAIAEGDASTAWCVVQNSGCSLSAAYMSPEAAREVFGGARDVLAWGFPAGGPCRANPAEGGWKVSGSWGFGSGNRHSTWLGGHCQLTDASGKPLTHADGGPIERTMLFPRKAATIRDNLWDVVGLRGTGSDTYSVAELFVPAARAIVPRATGRDLPSGDGKTDADAERREKGTLYKFTGTNVYQCGFAAVGLGIARAMLTSFTELAKKKAPSGATVPLKDDHWVQSRIAMSEARLASARAWLQQLLGEMREEVERAGRVSFDQRVRIRLASTYAIHEARIIVEDAWSDAGATAIFESNPFERRMRDMHAVSQQIQASAAHFQTVGQYYLGLTPSARFI